MSAYRDQSAPDRLKLWERIRDESPAELAVSPHTVDAGAQVARLQCEVGQAEAGFAATITPRTELLPPAKRTERTSRGLCAQSRQALGESGPCECLSCKRPTKDLGERVKVVGSVASLRNARAEAYYAAKLAKDARREANRLRQAAAVAKRSK